MFFDLSNHDFPPVILPEHQNAVLHKSNAATKFAAEILVIEAKFYNPCDTIPPKSSSLTTHDSFVGKTLCPTATPWQRFLPGCRQVEGGWRIQDFVRNGGSLFLFRVLPVC